VLQPPEDYVLNLSQVSLTAEALNLGKKSKPVPPTVVQVTTTDISGDEITATLCTLEDSNKQESLQIVFGWDEKITFSLAKGGGTGPVSLSGYLQPSPDEEDFDEEDAMNGIPVTMGESDDEDEESEEEEEEAPVAVPVKRKRQNEGASSDQAAKSKKQAKVEAPESEDESEDDEGDESKSDEEESEDDEDDDEEETTAKVDDQDGKDESDEEESDEEESDEEEDSEDEDESEPATPEDKWAADLVKKIKSEGGSLSASVLGSVARPQGIGKMKLAAFIGKRSEFKRNSKDKNKIELA